MNLTNLELDELVCEANMCIACQEKINTIDYKDARLLRKFTTGQFKIVTGKRTGLCPKHQRQMSAAIKHARFMALMPYTRSQIRK